MKPTYGASSTNLKAAESQEWRRACGYVGSDLASDHHLGGIVWDKFVGHSEVEDGQAGGGVAGL